MKKKISAFEYAIMEVASLDESKKHEPFTRKEEEEMRKQNLIKQSKNLHLSKELNSKKNNNGWIKIDFKNLILPVDGTEVHFYNKYFNENGIQNEYHKGIFNAALGFTSYYDSENYKINEITHYQPIIKPKPTIY